MASRCTTATDRSTFDANVQRNVANLLDCTDEHQVQSKIKLCANLWVANVSLEANKSKNVDCYRPLLGHKHATGRAFLIDF